MLVSEEDLAVGSSSDECSIITGYRWYLSLVASGVKQWEKARQKNNKEFDFGTSVRVYVYVQVPAHTCTCERGAE